MAKLLRLLLVLILLLVSISVGCTPGTPSEEDIEKTLLSYLRQSAAAVTENTSRNVESVEVIEVSEPFEQGRMTMWTVKVNIVSPRDEEQAEYIIFKDIFGSIKVLRRSASHPFQIPHQLAGRF